MSHAFMTFYPGDYLGDTGHLSTEEHGGYLLLLLHAWTQNGVLPLDDELLRRITKMTPRAWAKSRAIIMKFFHLQDDGYHQKRMDKELAKARAMVAKKRDAVLRTQHWREANPHPKPNGHAPPVDPPVMHNERITDAQQGHNVMPRLSAPQPLPEPQLQPVREKKESKLLNLLPSSAQKCARETPSGTGQDGQRSDYDAEHGVKSLAEVRAQRAAFAAQNAADARGGAFARRVASALDAVLPAQPKRERAEQLAAMNSAGRGIGQRQYCEPVRSVAEQIAAAAGISLEAAQERLAGTRQAVPA